MEQKSNTLEYVVPMPIEECVRRLEERHEKSGLAWRGQMRTWVQIRQEDPDMAQFTLKRVGKGSAFPWGSAVIVCGNLTRSRSESTAVQIRKYYPYFWIMLFLALVTCSMVALLLSIQDKRPSEICLIIGVASVVAGVGIYVSWMRERAQMRVLVSIFKEAIGGEVVSRW